MKRFKAIIFLWLMLAIPLQAVAGSLMICAPVQQTVLHAEHYSPLPQHHVPEANAAGHAAHVHGHAVPATLDPHNDVSCDPCAACSTCALGMAATVDYRLPAVLPVSDGISYAAFHIPSVDPDRPDDPPRVLLI